MSESLVIGAEARFLTSARRQSVLNASAPGALVVVQSPQFRDGLWEFKVHPDPVRGVLVEPNDLSKNAPRNRYVEVALRVALMVCLATTSSDTFWRRLGSQFHILIRGHNDFYSQREQLRARGLPVTTEALAQLDQFCDTLTTISEVHKTGLGSSAAMISSLVGAILCHFGSAKPESEDAAVASAALRLIHNAAQLAHCLAQGKVGSGFDVSAAVYGSHVYRRFSPATIDSVMERLVRDGSAGEGGAPEFHPASAADVYGCVAAPWDNEYSGVRLPPGCRLMLGDVDAGSNTPKLVSGVLAWRKEKPEEANALWDRLHSLNLRVQETLRAIDEASKSDSTEYAAALSICSKLPADQWDANASPTVSKFVVLAETFQQVRAGLRKMSELAKVPVEPPEQTRLLDACLGVRGVVMAGVPGAGGFDAIFVVVVEEEAAAPGTDVGASLAPPPPRQLVEDVWRSWTEMRVGPLLSRQSDSGLRVV
ncbi:phosphomevalonate kinase, partial [Cladochytrium tenue]